MYNAARIVSYVKWLCFPLGYIMYFFTKESFGPWISILLAVVATVGFWLLIRNEEVRLLGKTMAYEIRKAINDLVDAEFMVEIKSTGAGIVARVFFVKCGNHLEVFRNAIQRQLDEAGLLGYLWVLQMVDMESADEVRAQQEMMNAQIIHELKNAKKRKKSKE